MLTWIMAPDTSMQPAWARASLYQHVIELKERPDCLQVLRRHFRRRILGH